MTNIIGVTPVRQVPTFWHEMKKNKVRRIKILNKTTATESFPLSFFSFYFLMLRLCYCLVEYRREGRSGGGGTRQSELKLIRSIGQMHLVMIVNKHATKYSVQVPFLSEVVERDRFLARGNTSCL